MEPESIASIFHMISMFSWRWKKRNRSCWTNSL